MGNVLLRPPRDPASLINANLDGKGRRAIDIHKRDEIGEIDFKYIVRDAVASNELYARDGAWWTPARSSIGRAMSRSKKRRRRTGQK